MDSEKCAGRFRRNPQPDVEEPANVRICVGAGTLRRATECLSAEIRASKEFND